MTVALFNPDDGKPRLTIVPDLPTGQRANGTRSSDTGGQHLSGGDSHERPDNHEAGAVTSGPILRDPLLRILADSVDDLERVRIATDNRLRQLTRVGLDKDGGERGLGLSEGVPEVKRLRDIAEGLDALEHQAVLAMNRQIRKNPLWIALGAKRSGVGEKQFARLLASIGDPYWNDLHQRPRTVSELWAYCGYSVVRATDQAPAGDHISHGGGTAQKKLRGQRVNWSPDARMRCWLIAESCVKNGREYRAVYDAARLKYAEAVHGADCVRCGPAGKPALVGSPLSAGHQHARAMRAISKELLRELWVAAKELHTI